MPGTEIRGPAHEHAFRELPETEWYRLGYSRIMCPGPSNQWGHQLPQYQATYYPRSSRTLAATGKPHMSAQNPPAQAVVTMEVTHDVHTT